MNKSTWHKRERMKPKEGKLQRRSEYPIVSVCIANYNGVGFIEDCLHSVMEQDCNFPFEVIVHDDASSDGSVEFIRDNFPDVVLIPSGENVGFCVSNNRMVASAVGKYILLLNNDAMLLPDALRTLHENAERESMPTILGIRQLDAATGGLIDYGILLDPFLNSVPNTNLDISDVGMVLGACLWIPKDLWSKIGGFPEWFHTMHEDMYICCRARLYGFPVRVIPESGYRHWVGRSLGGGKVVENRLSTPLRRRALSERNRLYVICLCYPDPLFSLILPVHIALLILEGILLASIKKESSILRLIYLRSIKALWQKRKKLLHLRQEIHGRNHIAVKNFFSTVMPIPHKLRMLIKHGLPDII